MKILPLITALMFSSMLNAQTVSSDKLAKINAVANHSGVIYAATNGGLYQSNDSANSWTVALSPGLPATIIAETGQAGLFAFIVGKGLHKLDDKQQWKLVNNQLGSQVLMSISADAAAPSQLVGLNQYGKLIVSEDGGKNWHGITGLRAPKTPEETRGKALFDTYCQVCHGIEGVGETYTLQSLTDQKYLMAPALDTSAHAWHHTDDALVETILNGSSRPSRMPAWKKQGLNEQNARDLVAYIKSLWTQRELDCQGPKHMQCMK
jgi:mono/diheme cytochrome c family protein